MLHGKLEEQETLQEKEGGSAPSSTHDALTGLLNRDGFNAEVRSLIATHPGTHYTIVYADIDRFKVYNDRFGTAEGDRFLAHAGAMISKSLPEGVLGARLRADHFVFCYERSSFDPGRMLSVANTWFASYRQDFTFFARLGVYEVDEPDLEVDLMCDRALLALRAAKTGNTSSRYVFYHKTLRDSLIREQDLAGEMLGALKEDQFVPYFQPQFDYDSGCMIGAEVLARWNHPVRGLLAPMDFIPVFERTGLITEFDLHMLETACRCLSEWYVECEPENVPRLSVNLSRMDVYRSDLCEILCGFVRKYRIPFEALHLEITESAYLEAPEQLVEIVTELRHVGFTVEMDDFGSGYSSLNTLKDVPVDVLKLDMGFLDEHDGSRGGLILASVVRMAHWLDLPTIAEGVETAEQAAYLSSVGCNYMQGFLFSKPMDKRSFENLFKGAKIEKEKYPMLQIVEGDDDFWNVGSRLALVFNNYTGATAIAELNGNALDLMRANKDFACMFGLAGDGAEGPYRNILEGLCAEDRAALMDAARRATAGECTSECEFCRTDAEGANHWIRLRMRLLSHVDDAAILQLLAEEDSEARALRNWMISSTEPVLGNLSFYEVSDKGIRVIELGDSTAELVGYNAEECRAWIESDLQDDTQADAVSQIKEAAAELVAGASKTSRTINVKRHGADNRWVYLSLSVVHRGKSLFVAASALDVTADREKQEWLENQRQVQQRLYNAIPCGIVSYTVGDEPRMVWMNQQSCTIFGYRDFAHFLEVTGGSSLSPIVKEDKPKHREVIEKLLQGAPSVDFSYCYYKPDKTTGFIEGTSTLDAGSDGEPLVQSAFLEVSDRQRERHSLDIQRYATVFCSIYEEIFEIDSEKDTFRMLFSANRKATGKTLSVKEALDMWERDVLSEPDRASTRKMVEDYIYGSSKKPATFMYKLASQTPPRWIQATTLRVSPTSVLCCNKDVTDRLTADERKVVQRIADTLGQLPVGVGVFMLREENAFPLYVNDLMCTTFGFAPEEYANRIDRNMPVFARNDIAEYLQSVDVEDLLDHPIDMEHRMSRKDGAMLDVRIQGRALRDEQDDIILYVVITDISEEVKNRREHAWQNERYRLLSEMTHSISFDYDSESDTVLFYIDRTGNGVEAQVIPNYMATLEDARGSVVHPDSLDDIRAMFEDARMGKSQVSTEYQADYYGKGYAWYRANLFVAHDEAGFWHLVGLIEDIDDERELRFRAEFDATTGLVNHAAAKEYMTAALSDPEVRERSVCVVLDIDDFKCVNDEYGHIMGDTLLHELGTILSSNFREDDIVGRVGGDEFVLLLKRIDLEKAKKKMETVRDQVRLISLEGLEYAPSISVGMYAVQPNDKTYRDAFIKADEALYQAKRSGKDKISVYRACTS